MAKKRLFVGLTCIVAAVVVVAVGIFLFVNAYNGNNQTVCEHVYGSWVVVEASSCVREGKEQHECNKCGHKEFRATEKAEHKMAVIPAVAADCTHDGLTDGLKCSVCGEIFTEQRVVKASHTVDAENAVIWTTTMYNYALVDSKCSVCGKQYKNQPYSGYYVKDDQALWFVNGNRIYLDGRYFTYKGGVYYAHDNKIVTGHYIVNGAVCYFGEDGIKQDGDITNTYVTIGEDLYYVIDNEPIKDCYFFDGENVYYFSRTGKRQNTIISDEAVNIGGAEYYVIDNKIVYNYSHLDISEGCIAYYGADGARTDDELPCKSSVFSTSADAKSTGFIDIKRDGESDLRTYYVVNNKILYGYQIIDGTVYYFGTDGVKREPTSALNDILLGLDENTYCVKNNELLKDGYLLVKLGISTTDDAKYYAYYFDADGVMLTNGEKDGMIFGEHGFLTGNGIFVSIDGKIYEVNTNVLTLHEHAYATKINVVSPRCETAGSYDLLCVCGAVDYNKSSSALGHVYSNGSCLRCGADDPNWVEEAPIYTREGDEITLGSYPQTDVTGKLGGTLKKLVTASDWKDYGYYSFEGADGVSYMFYADVEYNGEKYRGVKLNDYRPYWLFDKQTAGESYSYTEYTYQDDNGYTASSGGAIYWFKYEPVKWSVIAEEDGKALLVSNLVIDAQPFDVKCDEEGTNISSNDYSLSTIRSWLNEEFYNLAFNEKEAELVCALTVDNSAKSTGVSTNAFACENVKDKVFLLSVSEVDSLDSGILLKGATDYAKCQGVKSSGGNCGWWLRSPAAVNKNSVNNVSFSGTRETIEYTHNSSMGVVPAMWIKSIY